MAGVTKTADIHVTAREIDFVTRFAKNWDALREILGIMRPIRKQPGTSLKYKVGSIVLENGNVGEGEVIPYSKAAVNEVTFGEMDFDKYRKGVSIEAIKDHGYDVAVGMTDEAMLNEIQSVIMGRFYTFLNTGSLTSIQTTFQMALSMAKGLVVNKFKKLHRTATNVVGFVNVLDVYEYIGAANITVQNQFGFEYIKDFMGYSTVFLLSEDEIARGKVIATPVENIVNYYIDPADSDFAQAGLAYRTDGETNLVGFHVEGNYGTAVSDAFAIDGMTLFAEYLDGIAVVTVEASGSLGAATITSAAGTTAGTKITLTAPTSLGADWHYFIKAATTTAPSAPAYKAAVDSTWEEIIPVEGVVDNVTGLTTGDLAVLVITNGSGQTIAASASAGVAVVNKT